MNKFQKTQFSEFRAGYVVESEFSREFVNFQYSLVFFKSENFKFVKSQFSYQFVKSVYLNLFGSRLGLLCFVAGQVQGAAM